MEPRLSEAVSAFATEIDAYRRLAFGTAFRVLGDARRAEAVSQRAFATLFETGLSRVRPNVPQWLLETVYRESLAAADDPSDAFPPAGEARHRRWSRSGARTALERLMSFEHPGRD